MNPKVAQILARREEIATHQKHLQTLEGDLNEQEKAELAEASNANSKSQERKLFGAQK